MALRRIMRRLREGEDVPPNRDRSSLSVSCSRSGGRPEGLIPLMLGSLAAFNLWKLVRQLDRILTGIF